MTETTAPPIDTVDAMLGTANTAAVADLRGRKPELIDQLEAYYQAVFAPTGPSAAEFPPRDRALVALRVASFTGSGTVVAWYRDLALQHGADESVIAQVASGGDPETGSIALDAALIHTDLLTQHPVDATADDLAALKAAGLTPGAILALSQTVAFVSYQLRLVAGFRAIGELG